MQTFLSNWRAMRTGDWGVPIAVPKCIGMMVVASVIIGCTEAPTSPDSPLRPPVKALLATSAETGSGITVWDASGLSFTLNVANREIQRGDGLVIELSPEETAQAASAFLTIVAGDQIGGAMELDCYNNPRPACVEPYRVMLDEPSTSAVITRLSGSHPSSQKGGRFGTHVLRRGPMGRRPPRDNGSPFGVEAMSGDWPSSCLDIATAIYEKMPEYNDSRNVYTNTLKELWPPLDWEDGSPRIKLKDYPEALIALGLAFHRLQSAELQLNIMAGLYTASGCWNNTWQDFGGVGSSSGGGGGSLGSGYDLVCLIETWEISYDGGVTWYYYGQVSVCWYEYTM